MSTSLEVYSQHSVMSDPGQYAHLFEGLPMDLPALHQVVQNVLIHVWKIRKYRPELLENRTHEIETRSTVQMLERIQEHDSRPLTHPRDIEQKLIVDCRHFAALLCAILRHKGIAARVRNGFATYLEKTHYQDHWVCEYWRADEARWVVEDPDVKMHNLSRDQFMVAGQAWQVCRSGQDDPNHYGYGGEWLGMWTVCENLVRDLAALNKVEEMSLATWGLIRKPFETMSSEDLALLDQVAALTIMHHDTSLDAILSIYQNTSGLRVTPTVNIYNYLLNQNSTLTVEGSVQAS